MSVRFCYSITALVIGLSNIDPVKNLCCESLGKKSKNVFRFFEFRLGINFFHFRLRCFGEVGSRLGSPEAGVEIGTG